MAGFALEAVSGPPAGVSEVEDGGVSEQRLPAVAWATFLVLLVLVGYNVATNRWIDESLHPIVAAVAAAALVLIARSAGFDWESIGLGRDGIGPDGRSVAWRAMGVIIAVIVGVSLFPAGREFFTDDRVLGMSGWELAYEMAFRIPFVTAGFEELAFRGVLLGLLTALWGAKRAIVASSVLFGVWHVLPTLSDQSSNAVGEDVPIWVGIATTMVVTFLAGLVLCRLRAAGRGIPAPIVAHATLNGTALLVAYLVTT